jgi:cytochrome c oxidase assembly protein subunit 15
VATGLGLPLKDIAQVVITSTAIHADPQGRTTMPVAASVASWLGVLFVMLFALNTIGGWVRLSGSGVAIPQWPIINGSLLPPLSDAGWEQVKAHYDADQERLAARVRLGELSAYNLGHSPRDLDEFKAMFMTEWSHRLFAALVGVMAAGCLTIIYRRAPMRRLIGVPMSIAGLLIIAQAVLGGMLVKSGTNTNWLFLHQANASLIMACVLVSILRILADGHVRPAVAVMAARRPLVWFLPVVTVAVWAQLVIGSLVAGSRNGGHFGDWALSGVANLWHDHRSLWWNLQANAELHQWAHRWLAWGIVLVAVWLFVAVWQARRHLAPRLRLALHAVAAFLMAQMLLGIANVWTGITPWGSLAHQGMGMCLFLALVLAWFDAHREATPAPAASREVPA